jgi:hypothetical protein
MKIIVVSHTKTLVKTIVASRMTFVFGAMKSIRVRQLMR